jgi:hypothetical protein
MRANVVPAYPPAAGVSGQPSPASMTLAVGGMDHLLRYLLTGCAHSSHVAARLFSTLSEHRDLDAETRDLCDHLCQALESGALARN